MKGDAPLLSGDVASPVPQNVLIPKVRLSMSGGLQRPIPEVVGELRTGCGAHSGVAVREVEELRKRSGLGTAPKQIDAGNTDQAC